MRECNFDRHRRRARVLRLARRQIEVWKTCSALTCTAGVSTLALAVTNEALLQQGTSYFHLSFPDRTLLMRVVGLAGWSGAGKTTLLRRVIPALTHRGMRVSTVKHAHHSFDIDQPGKDSWQHREAGAREVLVASNARWVLMHELRGEAEPPLPALLARMAPVDLVLVEGFKRQSHPKIEVHRTVNGKPLLHPSDPSIVAVVSDVALPEPAIPQYHLDDIDGIVTVILGRAAPIETIRRAE